MVGYLGLRDRSRRATIIAYCIIAVSGLLTAEAATALAGTKTGAALALATTLGPPLIYCALVAPTVFPLGFYLFLIPLDGLLSTSSFGTITKILGALSAGVLILYMLRTRKAVEPPRATVWWLLLYLWAISSLFWAIDLPTAEQALPTVLELFGLYFVISMLPVNRKTLHSVLAFTIAGSAMAALFGVYFFHTPAGQAAAADSRLFLTTDNGKINPDHLAAAMVLPVTLAGMTLVYNRNFWIRIGSLISIVAMLYTIDLCSSRGAVLAVGAAILYLIVRDRHRLQLGALLGVMVAAVLATSGQYLIQRFGESSINGGAGRADIWHVGLLAFKEHWLFGAGYANFPFAYDGAFIQVPESFYTHWHRASHNILLNTSVELGIIGLIFFVCAWIAQFRLIAIVKPDHQLYPLRIALEASLIGLFVAGLFADIMPMKYAWLPFILIALTRNAILAERTQPIHA